MEYLSIINAAWHKHLDVSCLLQHAEMLEANSEKHLSIILYTTWLRRNKTPLDHLVYFNLGVALYEEAEISAAIEAYTQAIELVPFFAQARFNLGICQEKQGNYSKAIEQWRFIDDTITPDNEEYRPSLLMALKNLGRLLESQKQYANALHYLTKSITIEPNQSDVLQHWVFLREKQCAWPVYPAMIAPTETAMRQATSALAMLSLSDDPKEQLETATRYVKKEIKTNVLPLIPESHYQHPKIRVGYCSSDFTAHPVAMLTVELFELHNRDEFEVFGFCWTTEDNSEYRKRVINAFDNFFSLAPLNDEEAAQLIRSHEIDILIDLHGQTLGARPNIFSYRPAPIQITYLGLPATTGLPEIDYVIADKYLIPEYSREFYTEKPLYMPDVYQVSDRKRSIAETKSREYYGLPSTGFVFCSFNNNYKYTPEIFSSWMRILDRVPDSVLWLLADNPWAKINLINTAKAAGIDTSRLIFGNRMQPEDYLARYRAADLFLDTFPFNAGTTANDALWMELPVLTMSGQSFASRMAGALLTAAKLPELITYSINDYEDKAVELAQSPDDCARLRYHLRKTKIEGVLFDTPRFVNNLEHHFKQLVYTE